MSEKTIAQRFVEAFGSHDLVVLSELYSDDVVLYSPPVWGQKGKQAFLDYADGEFYSPDGAHGCFQFVFHWYGVQFFVLFRLISYYSKGAINRSRGL